MIHRLAHSLVLLALVAGTPVVANAQSKEPSSLDVSEFNRVFGNMKRDIDDQIERKGRVFPATIKRTKESVDKIIGYIEKSGADPTPFRQQVDAYLSTVNQRASSTQRSQDEAKISTAAPNIVPLLEIETVPAVRPTWCAPITAQYQGPLPTSSDLRLPEFHGQIQLSTMHDVLLFSCSLPDFAPTQAWTQAYRQRISNILGMTVADNEAFMKRAASLFNKRSPRASDEATARCAPLPGKTNGVIEGRIYRDLERGVVGCGNASGRIEMQFNGGTPLWLVDLPGTPSTELAKLGFATELLSNNVQQAAHLFNPSTAPDPSLLSENYGLAHTLDVNASRVWSEIDTLGYGPEARFNVDAYVRGELAVLQTVGRFVRAAAVDNPNLKAVFLDGPEKGLAAYLTQVDKSAKALDLLLAIEDRIGSQPGGSDGCAQALYAELTPWLRSEVKRDNVSQAKDLTFDDLLGSTLYQGLLTCGTNDATAPMLAYVIEETFGPATNIQRGPVSAAYKGMLDAYNDNRANPAPKAGGFSTSRGQTQTVVEVAQLHRSPVSPPVMGRKLGPAPYGFEKRGVIASIQPADGGFSKVSFLTESVKKPIRDCKETGRIARIDNNGRLVPEYNCRTTGWETVKVTPKPIELPRWLAENHRPGQLLVYRASDTRNPPSKGWPLAAYSNASGTVLVSLLGVPLK